MFLALFPLQLALFPGEEVPLHIFEPRYKQLISECRDEGILFGIPAYVQGNLSVFGTEVELVKILKTFDNGEMDIVVRGTRVFKIVELQTAVPGKLYSGARVEFPQDRPGPDGDSRRELSSRYSELMRLLKRPATALDRASPGLSYRVGADVGLSLTQRVHILSLDSEADRCKVVLEHIDRLLRAVRERPLGPGRISSNGRVRFGGRRPGA